MRIHLLGIPHTATSNEKKYLPCAFTQKVFKAGQIFTHLLGYLVYHYGHEHSTVQCSEHITVTEQEDLDYSYGKLDTTKDHFEYSNTDYCHQTFYKNAEKAIRERAEPGDFLLCYWGIGHWPLVERLQDLQLHVVEPGIGYDATFAPHRIFESYWRMAQEVGAKDARNRVRLELGEKYEEIHNWHPNTYQHYTQPSWTDDVVYNYWDHNDFECKQQKQDYLFFIGRIIWTKGLDIAMHVANYLGMPLKIAGQGWHDFEKEYGFKPFGDYEYVGTVGIEERKELMANAKAVLVPTRYPEPFGGVHAESMFSGTPPITSNLGVFTEVIRQGYNGYRAMYFEDYIEAVKNVDKINPLDCRDWAMDNYTLERAALRYDECFKRILRWENKAGNFWYLPKARPVGVPPESVPTRLDHFSQEMSYEESLEKLKDLGPMRDDGDKYHPGGSIKGGDPYLREEKVWDYCVDTCEPTTLLDIGAGEGHVSQYFKDKGVDVIAFDMDTEAIENAVFPVLQHDLAKAPFESKKVDMIYCSEVLEHIPAVHLPNLTETIKCADAPYCLITFAKPGSLGVGHINLQEEDYWLRYFRELGYTRDEAMTKKIRELAAFPCFQENSVFFIK